MERSFADGKELHGHRYARFRGLSKVQMQCLLSAACQNMKKIALHVWEGGGSPLQIYKTGCFMLTCLLKAVSFCRRPIAA